jgi:hypothetical protein
MKHVYLAPTLTKVRPEGYKKLRHTMHRDIQCLGTRHINNSSNNFRSIVRFSRREFFQEFLEFLENYIRIVQTKLTKLAYSLAQHRISNSRAPSRRSWLL